MIYLDNAATTFPKPNEVYDSVLDCMKNYCANPGRSSNNMAVKCEGKIMEVREEIGGLFNIADPLDIIFTGNATQALNIGIKGILKSGDHVISTMIEHNSVLRPLNSLSKRGVNVTLISTDKAGYINIDDIKQEIKKNTKMIILSHVSNVLGSIQNIKSIGELARKNGVLFMVDAAQSAGILPIDVEEMKIDLLALSGHKGLYGPQGTGILYIRNEIDIDCFVEGGTGSNSHYIEQPDFMPDKFESGTLNTPGIIGLGEGIKFIKNIGINKIQRHEKELTCYLLEELKSLSYIKIYGNDNVDNRTGVISFNIDDIDASEVGEKLNDFDIAVRTGYHCAPFVHDIIGTDYKGTVRVSFSYFNTFEDVEALLNKIKIIYEGR